MEETKKVKKIIRPPCEKCGKPTELNGVTDRGCYKFNCPHCYHIFEGERE